MILFETIGRKIAEASGQHHGQAWVMESQHPVSGGCINRAFKVSGRGQSWFVKINQASLADMFEAEAEALRELAASQTLRVPQPLCTGVVADQSYLVLEYLELGGQTDMARLGQQLAALHRVTQPQYGWQRDNTIGSTPQLNEPHTDWVVFWRQQRLGYQLQRAAQQGYGGELQRLGEKLMLELAVFFQGYQPPASLLHGDLWGGNVAALADGTPVMFDPALYYGDRETDLAMTELFGGFSSRFYAAYNEAWPLDAGYQTRKTLYNLYHILNHLNLFGGGYEAQSRDMMRRLMVEIG